MNRTEAEKRVASGKNEAATEESYEQEAAGAGKRGIVPQKTALFGALLEKNLKKCPISVIPPDVGVKGWLCNSTYAILPAVFEEIAGIRIHTIVIVIRLQRCTAAASGTAFIEFALSAFVVASTYVAYIVIDGVQKPKVTFEEYLHQ